MAVAPQLAEDLFHEHSRRIYAFCLRQLGSREEAEDALQATYLNACRSLLAGFEPEAAQAWLFKVAQNVCLTHQRSSWRRRRVEHPEDLQQMQDFIAAPAQPGQELLGIGEALAALPGQQRRAILLREWQGLSYREVAAEMELSQGAVETLVFRARRSLAAALEEPEAAPKSRARLMRAFEGGALLASLKASLGGNLSASLATGLAVAASATALAGGPIGHVDRMRPSAQAVHARPVATTPAPRPALADRDPSSVARANPAKDKGQRGGHGKPAQAGKAHEHGSHGGGKPSWAGNDGPPAHAQTGGTGAGQGHS